MLPSEKVLYLLNESNELSKDEKMMLGIALTSCALDESSCNSVVAQSLRGKTLVVVGDELVDNILKLSDLMLVKENKETMN